MISMERTRSAKGVIRGEVLVLLAGVVVVIVFLALRGHSQPPTAKTPIKLTYQGPFADQQRRMIERHLQGRDITDASVLKAMAAVPRHEFVPDSYRGVAYSDRALPIGHGQTISQPYIVAVMTQIARPNAESKALDIGTGSGYQAAVLGEICKEVYSIEIVKPLAEEATKRLADLGYKNITVRHGDGYRGWPDKAPFDAIIVAAAPDEVPQPLVDQLTPGGRLVIPVGGGFLQKLLLLEKQEDGQVVRRNIIDVAFVPMTGEAQKRGER